MLIALAAGWAFDRYARSGELFGIIGRGLTRLFQRDLQRECAVDSAAFLIAYLLGLPCCAAAPSVDAALDTLRQLAERREREAQARAEADEKAAPTAVDFEALLAQPARTLDAATQPALWTSHGHNCLYSSDDRDETEIRVHICAVFL